LIITKAAVAQLSVSRSPRPGRLMSMPGSGYHLLVEAGDGRAVNILQLQPEGKRRMAAAEYLNGHPLQDIDYLGPEKK
jgi:methionyl-tRNA formyltransferase